MDWKFSGRRVCVIRPKPSSRAVTIFLTSGKWLLEMMLKQGAPGSEVLARVMQIAWYTGFDSQQRLVPIES